MEWFRNFMLGRRGPDQLTLALLIIYWPFSLLGRITGFSFLDTLALICLAVAVFRVFSKDLPRRERENLFFLKYWNKAASWLKNHRLTGRKKAANTGAAKTSAKTSGDAGYEYFPCPDCGQSLRIPRVDGEITVTCPKCGAKFDKSL